MLFLLLPQLIIIGVVIKLKIPKYYKLLHLLNATIVNILYYILCLSSMIPNM